VTPLRQRMLEDLQIRNYSPTTIRIYLHSVAEFAHHFHKPPDQLGPEHIRQYQLFLMKEKRVSLPSYIQMVCALRFFFTHTLSQKIAIERIPFPRREPTQGRGAAMVRRDAINDTGGGRCGKTRLDAQSCGVQAEIA
jgi:site-specific recombinase XerD